MTMKQPLLSSKIFTKKKEDTEKNMKILDARITPEKPALVSIKWDGWRMFENDGRVLCRSMDPPRNEYVRKVFAEMFRDMKERTGMRCIDGEAIGGPQPMAHNAMQRSTSAFNCDYKVTDWTFHVFDTYMDPMMPFEQRLDLVSEAVEKMKGDWPWLFYTDHLYMQNMEDVMQFLTQVEGQGGEGVMGRDPQGIYKFGRSSVRDGILWALKPYADGECVIEEVDEMMSNQNEATTDSRGYTKRSGGKAGMVPKGTMGRVVCRGLDPVWPERFHIGMGPGLDDDLRAHIWANQEKYIGQVLKYKYQAVGCVERPRQPKWMGLRGKADML